MTETNRSNQPNTGVRRSSRVKTQTKFYTLVMSGNRYACTAAQTEEEEFLHPYSRVLFKHIAVHN